MILPVFGLCIFILHGGYCFDIDDRRIVKLKNDNDEALGYGAIKSWGAPDEYESKEDEED